MARTVLVTGATSGIGRAAAVRLARRGHRVLATGRREEALASLAEEASGAPLETFRLDVTDAASREAAREEVDRRTDGAGLDVLVNNAGYAQPGPLETLPIDALRAQLETNVVGLLATTQLFLPGMRERGAGRIVNVSSIVGRISPPLQGAYNATKFAVRALSDALRREVAGFGVRVVTIEPGAIRTEFGEVYLRRLSEVEADGSPYAPGMAKLREAMARFYRRAPGPDCVARAIVRAVEARRPRVRYVAPFSARLLLAAAAIVPVRWLDAGMARSLALTRRKPRPA